MAIVYHVDKKKAITYVLWSGVIKASDFIDHVRRMTSDPDWQSSRNIQIADLRNAAVDSNIDEDVLEEVGDYFGEYLNKLAMLKAAIVTTVDLEKSNFFAGFMSHYDTAITRVFHNMKDAAEWLGVDAAETESVFKKLRSTA